MGIEVAFVERGHPVPREQPAQSWARRGQDEGRNPIPLLAQWWLNLEHRGSAGVFFHLKANLIPFVVHGRRPCGLQGSSSCGCWRGWQRSFQLSSPFPPVSSPLYPRKGLKSVSSSHLCPALEPRRGHEPPTAPIYGCKLGAVTAGSALDLLADPLPLGRAEPRAGRARLCQCGLYLTTLMQLNSRYGQFGKRHSCDAHSSQVDASKQAKRKTITIHQRSFIPSGSVVRLKLDASVRHFLAASGKSPAQPQGRR